MRKVYDAVVGVSVNPEMELVVKDAPGPKKGLKMSLCFSGSGANTGGSVQTLGGSAHVLGLVEVGYSNQEESLEGLLLKRAVKQSRVLFTPIPVLSNTNFAAIPIHGNTNGEVWGDKGDIIYSALPSALQILTEPEIGISPQTFVVITGLRNVEVPFAKALLNQAQPGFRVLNAKDTLCASKEFKKILPLVDMLVLNQHEFKQTDMRISDLHAYGVNIVVVTHDKEGGIFSKFSYPNPHKIHWGPVSFLGGKFETGAGDWFLGAMISEFIRLKESMFSITLKKLQEIINFAATVAGKKITMPGGGNGPSRHQLR